MEIKPNSKRSLKRTTTKDQMEGEDSFGAQIQMSGLKLNEDIQQEPSSPTMKKEKIIQRHMQTDPKRAETFLTGSANSGAEKSSGPKENQFGSIIKQKEKGIYKSNFQQIEEDEEIKKEDSDSDSGVAFSESVFSVASNMTSTSKHPGTAEPKVHQAGA